MTPSRPYLLRALHNWILDNHMTPHIVINANYKGVVVPREHVENGQIILCVAPQSVHGMEMKNDHIALSAKFSGISKDIYLPIMSVTAIYAEENRKGMVFAEEVYEPAEDTPALEAIEGDNSNLTDLKSKKNSTRPQLKIVSSNTDLDDKNNK